MAVGDYLSPDGRAASPRVLTPMLAVFPGTTAAYAALEFMTHARDLPEADRERIALVYVDTDNPHPDLVDFRRKHSGLFRYEKTIRIAVPRHDASIDRVLQGDQRPNEPHTYVEGKQPDPFENGAGGIRNNGHVAFCHDADEITKGLNEAITQITSRKANASVTVPRGVRVSITAFIGGGTASGIVADLACLTRQLLDSRNLDPRVTVTCILPTSLSTDDAELRQSNAVACMLEIIALSMASGADGRPYRKYVRSEYHELPPGPIAHEIFLIGSANMEEPREVARIAGMDLFQKTLDGSGVGVLDASQASNVNSLGWRDDRRLPTMFGVSCPLEARFPAWETARAFAQMAAAEALPRLIGYELPPAEATPEEEQQWRREWERVAAIEPGGVDVPDMPRDRYRDLDAGDLDPLWQDEVEPAAAAISRRVAELVELERRRQQERILRDAGRTPEERTRHWGRLQREYAVALADLRRQAPAALPRPVDYEHRATRRLGRRVAENRLYEAHHEYLESHARRERSRLLDALLVDLAARVHEKVAPLSDHAARATVSREAQELRRRAEGSAAWGGRLDKAHPFQLHVLDLEAMGRTSGANPAVGRLYEWLTERIDARSERSLGELASALDIESVQQSGEQLGTAVTGFFEQRYLDKLREVDLLDLLAAAAPERRPGSPEPVDAALVELMGRLQALMMADLIAFDAHMGGKPSVAALRTDVFLSCPTRNGSEEEERLKDVAVRAGILPAGADRFRPSLDPHRLHVCRLRHGISLSTIYDFFSPVNSAMARYLRFREDWARSQALGSLPPHSCTELEQLVERLEIVDRMLRPRPGANGSGPGVAGSQVEHEML